MSNDDLTPAETLAAWEQRTHEIPRPVPDGYASPGQPPWPVETVKRKGVPGWAWFLIILGAMFLLCSGAALALTGGSGPANKAITTTTPGSGGQGAAVGPAATGAAKKAAELVATPKPPVYKLGTPIRGGDFTFTLHSKKCGIASVGSQYLSKKAQGSYCRLDLTVANVTKRAHYFIADGSVTVTDAKGREFSADGEAGVYGNKDGKGFMDEINPGNSVRAFVYFDVSGGVKLTGATFDAGLFTLAENVTVPLS